MASSLIKPEERLKIVVGGWRSLTFSIGSSIRNLLESVQEGAKSQDCISAIDISYWRKYKTFKQNIPNLESFKASGELKKHDVGVKTS